MNQSIFLVSENFFDNPFEGIPKIANDIISNCQSEKLSLVFDPVSEPFFEELSKMDHDLFEECVVSFFSSFDDLQKHELPWYCLDERSSFHINTLGELVMELDWETRGIYSFGLIPVTHKFTYFVYFFITPYGNEDHYFLVSEKDYKKRLRVIFNRINSMVKEKNKKGRKKK